MPFSETETSVPAYAGVSRSLQQALPRLASELAGVRVPLGFVAGKRSPMPCDRAAGATARAVPGAWLEVVPGAGHFPWFERPGCVRRALQRLTGMRPWQGET
jgi:pimeloyl-ACP methyl ester carboxylesterase